MEFTTPVIIFCDNPSRLTENILAAGLGASFAPSELDFLCLVVKSARQEPATTGIHSY